MCVKYVSAGLYTASSCMYNNVYNLLGTGGVCQPVSLSTAAIGLQS